MSLLRPFFASTPFPQNELNNLLSLLDASAHHPQALRRSTQGPVNTFAPRFDIKETKTAYELHGELPGVEQKDINIEFSEDNTLTVSGRTEYSRTEGSRPTTPSAEKVEEDGYESLETPSETDSHYHKATVEDAAEPGESSTTPAPVESAKKQEVVKAPAGEVAKEKSKPKSRYWIQERSVGSFHRSFNFPVPVDQDKVKAGFKNGVLSVTVPKSEKPKVRSIRVE